MSICVIVPAPRCRPYMSVTLPKGTPLEDGVGADPSKFQKAVKVADKLGERIARTTDKIMEMRQDIDGKQVLCSTSLKFL